MKVQRFPSCNKHKRKYTFGLAVLTSASLLLVGCTSDSSDASNRESQTSQSSSSEATQSGEITLKNSWGEASYPVKPERVVATGTAVDNLLALGIKPTAIIHTPTDKERPWQKEKLEGVEIIDATNDGELPVEKIAAIHPDFIVGDYWRITEQSYGVLKDIAPTLGATGTQGGEIGWASQLKQLGKLYGKEAKAKEIVDADHKRFEEMKKAIPDLKGKTGIVAQFVGDSHQFGVVTDPKEPGNAFFYDLGMSVPESVQKLPSNSSGRAMVASENISALNADVMAIYAQSGSDEEMRQIPGYTDLTQVKKKATKVGDSALVQGLNVPSSLSREWLLKELRPELENAAK